MGGDVRGELRQHKGIPARKLMRPWVMVWLDILEGQSVWLSLPEITSVRTVWGSTRRPKREWARYGNWEPGARRRWWWFCRRAGPMRSRSPSFWGEICCLATYQIVPTAVSWTLTPPQPRRSVANPNNHLTGGLTRKDDETERGRNAPPPADEPVILMERRYINRCIRSPHFLFSLSASSVSSRQPNGVDF